MQFLKLLFLFLLSILLISCDANTTEDTQETVDLFVVTFIDEDQTILSMQTVEKGQDANPPTPEKEGHTFIGWQGSYQNIQEDTILQALYTINVYTVVFYDANNEIIKIQNVEHGKNATTPMYPTKAGHRFTGWSHDLTNITQDTNITPIYEIRTYTVILMDHDTEITRLTIDHGSNVDFPQAPEKAGHSFAGWSSTGENITSDTTIQAEYSIHTFSVTFFDANDAVVSTQTVSYLDDATLPTPPKKHGYRFDGWDKDHTEIKNDVNLYPQFTLETYSIVYHENLSTLTQSTWETKEAFLEDFYQDFFSWITEQKDILEGVSENNQTITIMLNSTTVTFSSVSELRALNIYDVEKTIGNLIYAPIERSTYQERVLAENNTYFLHTEPYRTKYQDLDRYFAEVMQSSYPAYSLGYLPASGGRVQIFFRFHQWNQGTAIPAFNALPSKYIYTNPLDISISLPSAPTHYTIYDTSLLPSPTYDSSEVTFLGWFLHPLGAGESMETIDGSVAQTLHLYAKWDTDPLTHDVLFLDHEFNILITTELLAGESLTPPEAPERLGYTFIGWDKDTTNITHDITFMPKYELNVYTITYHSNTNDATSLPSAPTTYTIYDNYLLPAAVSQGNLFLGWYLSSAVTGDAITNTTHGDLDLYAKWITLPSNGGELGDDSFHLRISQENLLLGQSARVYVKAFDAYFAPGEILFLSSNEEIFTVDATGFVLSKQVGTAFVVATKGEQVATIEITVTNNPLTYQWIGHMGSRGPFVQNTIEAFIEGANRGYYALEMDLRVSSDGIFYICHDDVFLPYLFVDTQLHNLPMASYTWDQLKNLEIKNTRNNQTYYATLTRLEDYLEVIQEYDVHAIIELKWTNGINNNDTRNIAKLIELVQSYGVYEKTTFFTSMQTVLTTIRTNYPDASLMYLSGASTTTQANIDWAITHKMSMGIAHNIITQDIVNQLHSAGLYVNAYTVNSVADVTRLQSLGVDFITTDDLT